MNQLVEVLRVQDARIVFKISIKKTKSIRLGIRKGEEMILGSDKIDQVDSFTYICSIISLGGRCSEDVTNGIAKAQVFFSQLKQELRAHMALVTRQEELRAKSSYDMSSNKILRINRLI